MAIMQNHQSGAWVLLRSHHVFGRAKNKTDTCINDPIISLVHASVRWSGAYWELIDHSRNGTWLNDERLSQSMKLTVGDKIAFKRDGSETWTLSDDTASKTMLLGLTDKARDIALDSIHMLPNEEDPELCLYMIEQGRWILAESNIEKKLSDGDIITLGPELRWRFQMALPASETLARELNSEYPVEECTFEFSVSADEEHTCLSIIFGKNRIDMGERVHHYLLLTLARKKLEDYHNGFGEDSVGWVEIADLQKMLGLDNCHLNIHIYRARQQIKKNLSMNSSDLEILERRIGSIRFAGKKYQITRAGEIEGDYQADCHSGPRVQKNSSDIITKQ
ncbi:MAG: FHA domain-containing protein [Gammaproteobacteria bacterium]